MSTQAALDWNFATIWALGWVLSLPYFAVLGSCLLLTLVYLGLVSSILCCTRVLSLKIAFCPSSNYTKLHIVL